MAQFGIVLKNLVINYNCLSLWVVCMRVRAKSQSSYWQENDDTQIIDKTVFNGKSLLPFFYYSNRGALYESIWLFS